MTRSFLTGFILLALSSQLIAQNISPTDFRIPESRYSNLLGGLQGMYGNTRSGISSDDRKNNDGNVSLSLTSLSGYNSESEAYLINSSVSGQYSHSSAEFNPDIFSDHRTSEKNTHQRGEILFKGQYSSYLIPDRVYLYGSGYLNGSYEYTHTTDQYVAQPAGTFFDKTRMIDGTLGAGLGYGKTREASSVFAVVRIIEKLTEDGYLTRELTKVELLEIVDIYAKSIEYSVHYERPTKYFLDDLLKKLETMGVLKDQRATAYEAARVEEVFSESIFPRIVGWTLQAGVSFGRYQYERSSNYSYSPLSWNVTKSEQNYCMVSGEYGYPFSLSLHWYNQAALALPIYGKQKIADQYVKSALYYQIGEKVSNELGVEFHKYNQYNIYSTSSDNVYSSNILTIENTFRYFLENNINFSVKAQYSDWVNRRQDAGGITRNTMGGFIIYFGLNYRFF